VQFANARCFGGKYHSYFQGIIYARLSVMPASVDFLLGLLFGPEDRGGMFL
jgi:hypothetical protein